MYSQIVKFLITLLFFTSIPAIALSSELRLETSKVEVRVNEEFLVNTVVSADQLINAVEGYLSFDPEMLVVKEIRDGNSSINFWIDPVKSCASNGIEKPGSICFSGITPGGFDGANNFLFSVVFEAKKEGVTLIFARDIQALRNDGEGTEEILSVRNAEIIIKLGDSKVRQELLYDREPPEDFTPIVSETPDLFEGKRVLIFSTQDKNSGITGYEIKESRFAFLSFLSPWIRAESPYILKDQSLKSQILVKAIDNLGNERIATILPRYPLSWHNYFSTFGIIIVVLALCIFARRTLWRKK
ncbi:hypothetical protein A2914_03095 [Candidatus Nomurabacteria bacterium RIFCSPLOWO2_01_FULL_41_21]|uniref:Cohesin domain-containing protein n=1 Tax=Candidatus Nomurabacteria bacterium RIFCSPLOWO2_01_FULL_41_21 TaxID=1801776 RepID=A0A1F6X3T3_9BACT|nr:MAG: hypothetical protein A2914_03095 [Candidatus Nomurabacteria bacterium RIFCSPLOWO2_01_FULL_41_21]